MCAKIIVATTKTIVPDIHNMKSHFASSSSSCERLWAGSPIAPNVAMRAAPAQVRIVPIIEYLVNGSFRSIVAKAVLKTKPDAWRVERTGRGRVVIWIVLPTRFDMMNMNIPICHFRLL